MIDDFVATAPAFNPRLRRFSEASPEALLRYVRRYDPKNVSTARQYITAVLDENRSIGLDAAERALALYGVKR